MGWVEYLVNDEHKLALQISRHLGDVIIDEDEIDNITELIKYIFDNEDLSIDVIKYIKDKHYYIDADTFKVLVIANMLNLNRRIHEDDLDKNYKILNKDDN